MEHGRHGIKSPFWKSGPGKMSCVVLNRHLRNRWRGIKQTWICTCRFFESNKLYFKGQIRESKFCPRLLFRTRNFEQTKEIVRSLGCDEKRWHDLNWAVNVKASDIVKAKSSGEDLRATGGLVSNLPHPRVNKTKQHIMRRDSGLESESQADLSPFEYGKRDLAAMASATRTMKQFKSRTHRSNSNPEPASLHVAKSAVMRSASLGLASAETRKRLYTQLTLKLRLLYSEICDIRHWTHTERYESSSVFMYRTYISLKRLLCNFETTDAWEPIMVHMLVTTFQAWDTCLCSHAMVSDSSSSSRRAGNELVSRPFQHVPSAPRNDRMSSATFQWTSSGKQRAASGSLSTSVQRFVRVLLSHVWCSRCQGLSLTYCIDLLCRPSTGTRAASSTLLSSRACPEVLPFATTLRELGVKIPLADSLSKDLCRVSKEPYTLSKKPCGLSQLSYGTVMLVALVVGTLGRILLSFSADLWGV